MRRNIVSLSLLLALALPCQAQDEKPKPNTLTAKEIAEGWILLYDGETPFGWKARVEQGYLRKFGDSLDMGANMIEVWHTTEFPAFEAQFEYSTATSALVGVRDSTGNARKSTKLARGKGRTSVTLRVVDGKVHFETPSGKTTEPWTGPAMIWFQPDSNHKIRNFKLRPLNTKSLFNVKDLDGWRVFPGDKYKSKFAVKDGAINVKDGPGDLQTVGKYKDFILQFDCISNGKHLNSGIFFRCRDNEYQNGYEAQIRNEFKAEPQKYLVEDYDPKTNKLIGKKEVLSPAFDFGTGAIYRRVPARKEMSKDNEWFTMTIAAHGNHLATWVNGVQQTDWTDNRPKSDNARTGSKLDAGHISIQGHDPTTDLSFKNFRIAEFK